MKKIYFLFVFFAVLSFNAFADVVLAADCQNWTAVANIGGTIKYDPALAVAGGKLIVAGVGTDDALWVNEFDPQTIQNEWYSLGGVLTSGPNLAQGTDGKIAVSGIGGDNAAVWQRIYQSSKNWSEWQNTNSTNFAGAGPSQATINGFQYRLIKEANNSTTIQKCAGQMCAPNSISGCKVCLAEGSGWRDDNSKCFGKKCIDGVCVNASVTIPANKNNIARVTSYFLENDYEDWAKYQHVFFVGGSTSDFYSWVNPEFRRLNGSIILTNYVSSLVACDLEGFKTGNHYDYAYITAHHPEWFLRDGNGNKMTAEIGGVLWSGCYYLDIGNTEFQNWAADEAIGTINKYAAGSGNGIAFDNVFPDLFSSDYANKYTQTQWREIWRQYFGLRMKPKLNQQGYLLFANLGTDLRAASLAGNLDKFMDNINGYMNEYFLSTDYKVISGKDWLSEISNTVWATKQKGKVAILNSLKENLSDGDILYLYGSFLLLKNDKTFFMASDVKFTNGQEGESRYRWHDLFDYDLGDPVGEMYDAGGLYQRNYSKAVVIVNPSDSETPKSINLRGAYYTINGQPVVNLVLPKKTAQIVLTYQCLSHATKKCYDNSVYWYNSCGVKEESNQNCDPETCYSGKCAGCAPNSISGCQICKADGSGWVDDNSKCASGQKCNRGVCAVDCQNWTAVGNIGGIFRYDPSLIGSGNGGLTVSGVGGDNNIWINEFNLSTKQGEWRSLGLIGTSRTLMSKNANDKITVSVSSPSGAVWRRTRQSLGSWSDWEIGNDVKLNSFGPRTAAVGDVFYRVLRQNNGSTEIEKCAASQTCPSNQISGCKVCQSDGSGWVDDNSKCASGQYCDAGVCKSSKGCIAKTCATLGNYQCGSWSVDCGNTISCGICAIGKACNNSGQCIASGGGGGGAIEPHQQKQMTRSEILSKIEEIKKLIAQLIQQLIIELQKQLAVSK